MSETPTFDELAEGLARSLLVPPSTLVPDARLVGDLCADSLDLYCLYLALDAWCPGFELPPQLDLDQASLADVHHYLVTRIEQGPPGAPYR